MFKLQSDGMLITEKTSGVNDIWAGLLDYDDYDELVDYCSKHDIILYGDNWFEATWRELEKNGEV